jgi:hypothetical protein
MRLQKFPLLALLGVLVVGVLASSAAAATPLDPEIVLPTRVLKSIQRADISLDRAVEYVDAGDTPKAVTALKAVRKNMTRVDKAARRQLTAVPADPEAETTPGPDSVIAALALDHNIVTTLAGLFDTKQGIVVDGISPLLFATMNARDSLLDAVIALDPEGAGAPYADAMPDVLPDFDDEVANFDEASSDDQLSAGGAKVISKALAQSQATQAKLAVAYGGGE